MPDEVKFIEGKRFEDARGVLNFVNDFNFENVCRFYQMRNADTSIVRAWQGHKVEHKYLFAAQGSFVIAWVKPDDFDSPSKDLKADHLILSIDKPGVLSIPPGFANGIKALEPNSILTIYSNLDLGSSESDRWSFDSSLWFDWSKY